MAKNKLIGFFMAIGFLLPVLLKAQSPAVDPNWSINNTYSDNFTPGSGAGYQNGINTSKWKLLSYASYIDTGIGADDWGGGTAFNPNYDSARTIGGCT